jgi:hypothetical protein
MKIVTTKITSMKLYYFTSTNLTLWIEWSWIMLVQIVPFPCLTCGLQISL